MHIPYMIIFDVSFVFNYHALHAGFMERTSYKNHRRDHCPVEERRPSKRHSSSDVVKIFLFPLLHGILYESMQ